MELYRKVFMSERCPGYESEFDTDKGVMKFDAFTDCFYTEYSSNVPVKYWFELIAEPKHEKIDDSVFEAMVNMFNPKNS